MHQLSIKEKNPMELKKLEVAKKGIIFSQLVPLCCNNIVGLAKRLDLHPVPHTFCIP